MKKLATFFALAVISLSLQAQSRQQTYTETFDHAFRNVNRTGVTTGILYDRVVPFANLVNFNSNVNPAVDTGHFSHFIQAYSELYRAAFDARGRLPWTVDDFREQIKANATEGVVDIGFLHFNFNMMDSVVGKQRLSVTDSVVVERAAVAGESLYLQKTAFVAAPLSAIARGTAGITFRFNNNFKFSNTPASITRLLVDFDDGLDLRAVSMGTDIFIAYSENGTKTLRFEATYDNGQSFTAYGQIDFHTALLLLPGQSRVWSHVDDVDIFAKIPFTNFYAGQAPSSGLGEGKMRIYYANSDKILRKPILLVDGFDPGNQRRFEEYRGDDPNGKSIWDLLYYRNDCGDMQHFGRQLLAAGYDLVMLDLPDGGGYIERNAMVCIEAINELNRRLTASGSQEQLVVVGPSMGGMITRYALAFMEQNPNNPHTNGGNHNTRLWISFDAPHQGANISFGAQEFMHFFGYVGGEEQPKKVYDSTINCVAAQQMLIKHHNNTTGSVFNTFYSNLNSLGYPNNLRRIAISNGSLNGTRNGTGCNLAVDMYTRVLGIDVNVAKIRLWPDNGTCEVFYGFFGSITPWWTWLLLHGNAHLATRSITRSADPGKCGIDGAPGSRFNTFQQVGQAVANNSNISKATIGNNNHTFMTTLSVLDVSGITDYCTSIAHLNLVNLGMTPFHAYWGPINKNMEHVSFDQDLANWIKHELGIPYIIGGSCLICGDVQATFQVENLPLGATVSWGSSSNINLSHGTGTFTTATRNPSASGQVFPGQITATFTIPGLQPIQRTQSVFVGTTPNVQQISSIYNGSSFSGSLEFIDFITYNGAVINHDNNLGIFEGEWRQISGGGVFITNEFDWQGNDPVYGTRAELTLAVNSGQSGQIHTRLRNGCDWSNFVAIQYHRPSPPSCFICWDAGCPTCTWQPACYNCWDAGCHICQPTGCPVPCLYGCHSCIGFCHNCHDDDCDGISCGHKMVFFPNPASDLLSIDLDLSRKITTGTALSNQPLPDFIYDIRLYDGFGNIVRRQQQAKSGTIEFNVSTLPEGTYYLHIYDGVSKTPQMHQIIVKR